jgi:hypothetical protein
LAREPHDDLAGLGRPDRFRTHQQDASRALFERLDPLAHRRRSHMQHRGRRVERALVDDGQQGTHLVEGKLCHHES